MLFKAISYLCLSLVIVPFAYIKVCMGIEPVAFPFCEVDGCSKPAFRYAVFSPPPNCQTNKLNWFNSLHLCHFHFNFLQLPILANIFITINEPYPYYLRTDKIPIYPGQIVVGYWKDGVFGHLVPLAARKGFLATMPDWYRDVYGLTGARKTI